MRRTKDPDRPIRLLRFALWAIAVLCLGTWGWVHLDAARFEAEAERRLDRAIADTPSAAGRQARALERAVERDLRELATDASDPSTADPSTADPRTADPSTADARVSAPRADRPTAGSRGPARGPLASDARRRSSPPAALSVDTTEVLGRLRIPRLGLSALIAEGIDERTLRRAAGRIPGTAPLLADGNVGIAGHRDGVFRDLARAAAGDLVLVETPAGTAHYRIEAVSIVGAETTAVLAATERPTLTLVTCYPFDLFGPATERWVVRARRVESPAG